MKWKPAGKLDLVSLEDRLPSSKKLVVTWIPNKGPVYAIVNRSKPKCKA